MSATLTWKNSGLGTKTGTTAAALYTDLATLFDSKSGDANFKWQKASEQHAVSPYYIVLKRKDGSAGRILIATYTGAPAGNNSAVLEGSPATNNVLVSYFPAGNVDTPSNLTASSGTILGDDTNCLKFSNYGAASTLYPASYQPYYMDSDEAVWILSGHTGAAAHYLIAASGYTLVDGSDNAVYANVCFSTTALTFFGGSSGPCNWAATDISASGSGTGAHIRTNYGESDRLYYFAYAPTGAQYNTAIGVNDPLSDTSIQKYSFIAPPLLAGYSPTASGVTKCVGIQLKLRQVAWGPQALGSFDTKYTTGPVAQAQCSSPASATSTGCPWFVNFKL